MKKHAQTRKALTPCRTDHFAADIAKLLDLVFLVSLFHIRSKRNCSPVTFNFDL